MKRRLSARTAEEAGFSLVELLVVVLIIALLAAMAIPIFLRQREKSYAAQVRSSLKHAALAAEAAALEAGGSYSILDDNEALLAAEGFNPIDRVAVGISATDDSFCIAASHEMMPDGNEWKVGSYSSTEGAPSAGAGTCPEAALLAGVDDAIVAAAEVPASTETTGGTTTDTTTPTPDETAPGTTTGGTTTDTTTTDTTTPTPAETTNGNGNGGGNGGGGNGGGNGGGGKKPK